MKIAFALVAALLVAGCSSSGEPTVVSTFPAETLQTTPPQPVPTSTQPAAHFFGAAQTVTTGEGVADVTVEAPRVARPSQYADRPAGTLYAVEVTFVGQSGEVSCNPLSFEARDSDGNTFDADLGGVDAQIAANSVRAGQKARGLVAFDVPKGSLIAMVILSDPVGEQLAEWDS